MRHLMPVKEDRHQLGGISNSTFYALVKEGELSLVKIGRRSFVQAEELDDFLRRKRYNASGRTRAARDPRRDRAFCPVAMEGVKALLSSTAGRTLVMALLAMRTPAPGVVNAGEGGARCPYVNLAMPGDGRGGRWSSQWWGARAQPIGGVCEGWVTSR